MNIVERAKSIILTPKTEWLVVAAEEPNIRQIVTEYVLPWPSSLQSPISSGWV